MKYRYLLLSVFILTSLNACVKKLDSKPKDFLQPSAYYRTIEQLNIALNGVYDNLGVLYSNPIHFRFGFEGDEHWYVKNSPLSGLHIYDYTAAHPDFQSFGVTCISVLAVPTTCWLTWIIIPHSIRLPVRR
jgi:hypothetical protein